MDTIHKAGKRLHTYPHTNTEEEEEKKQQQSEIERVSERARRGRRDQITTNEIFIRHLNFLIIKEFCRIKRTK